MFDLMPFDRRGNSLFNYLDDFEKNFFGDANFGGLAHLRTDIIDKGDKFLLQAELPGFKKEEIEIDIHDNTLNIRAEHKEEKEEKKDNYVKRERRYGAFSRSFDISNINADQITASYKEGVLELELPKTEGKLPEPKKIQID